MDDRKSMSQSDMHYDSSMVVTFFIRGKGNILVEGNNMQINEGDIVILNLCEFHRCFYDATPIKERISVYIKPSLSEVVNIDPNNFFSAFVNRALGQFNVIPSSVAKKFRLDTVFENINEPDSWQTEAMLVSRVIELVVKLSQAVKFGLSNAMRADTNKTVTRAIEFINENLTERVSTALVAKTLFVDKSYLCRAFKKYTGATIGEYVSKKRIDHAAALIKTGVSRTEACYISGFTNYSSFYRCYQRYVK